MPSPTEPVPAPDWWYTLVRDKVPASLPEGSYEALEVTDAREYMRLLAQNIISAAHSLELATVVNDQERLVQAAAEITDTMAHFLNASGLQPQDLEDELEYIDEELGAYEKAIYLKPSESAMNERLDTLR